MSDRHSTSFAVSRSDALARSRDGLRNRKRPRNGLRQLTPVNPSLPQFTFETIFQNEPTAPFLGIDARGSTEFDRFRPISTDFDIPSKVRKRTHRSPD